MMEKNEVSYVQFKSDGSYVWITVKNNKARVSRHKWYYEGNNLILGGFGEDPNARLRLLHLSSTKITIGLVAEAANLTAAELNFVKVPYSTISKYLK